MKKSRFKPGDFVRARYRARWLGIVIEVNARSDGLSYIIKAIPILDAKNQPQLKRQVKELCQDWLEAAPTPNVIINPDWLR